MKGSELLQLPHGRNVWKTSVEKTRQFIQVYYYIGNVCSEKNYTKHSSVLLLHLVYFFS